MRDSEANHGAPAHGNVTPVDLYAFGGSPENNAGPRAPRLFESDRGDIAVDAAGMVAPQHPPFPQGASTFSDPDRAPLTGHYYGLPAGTQLPDGLAVIADGRDVSPASPLDPTHHTIYPTRRMPYQAFVGLYTQLPWEYAGRKRR